MYRVIKHFTDLHDKNHPYNVGDIFPRPGIEVAEERLKELAGNDNKQGVPLIELVGENDTVPEDLPSEQLVKKAPTRKAKTKVSTE